MIPNLLWRCPLCHTVDALRHNGRWFGKERLWCSSCHAAWDVIRIIGGDTFSLRLLSPDIPGSEENLPISVWYERMKEHFTPQPLKDRSPLMKEDENLYLKGKSVKLVAQRDNTRFFQKKKKDEEMKKMVYPFMRTLGKGELLLTNQRLIWQRGENNFSLWFSDLDSVYIEVFHSLGLSCGTRIYKFKLHNDSYLKWLTYLAYLAPQRAEHPISFSHY
ncbi:MAG: hypothetical protein NT096_10635 [Proteobacteria bacterium]|nr:hypothetical protein [Pseudomonadota bacterium]